MKKIILILSLLTTLHVNSYAEDLAPIDTYYNMSEILKGTWTLSPEEKQINTTGAYKNKAVFPLVGTNKTAIAYKIIAKGTTLQEDLLPNTPKQMVVYKALGFELPKFYHVPMIHNSNGKKLSKRDGATDVMTYKEMGYLPEALLNFLVRLGWSYGDQEIFNFDEMRELFDPSNINKSASIYNVDKLDWLNAHYIKNSSNDSLATLLHDYGVDIHGHDKKEILLDALKERAKNMNELAELIPSIIDTPTAYDEKAVKKAFKGDAVAVLEAFVLKLESAAELHLPSDYHQQMEELVAEMEIGFGKIGMPLRVALLGAMGGPGMDSVMAIIGKDETISRINSAVSALS